MNVYHIVGAIITVAIIAFCMYLHRVYKRIGRRCTHEGCGRTTKRISKILLPPDEARSYRSSKGRRRWWIRRVTKLTFTICEKHGAKLVKWDTDPITVWHTKFAQRYHREQYIYDDQELIQAAWRKRREWYLGGKHENLSPGSSDTPPMSLETLFQGFFDEIDEIIGVK